MLTTKLSAPCCCGWPNNGRASPSTRRKKKPVKGKEIQTEKRAALTDVRDQGRNTGERRRMIVPTRSRMVYHPEFNFVLIRLFAFRIDFT
jgi:hypothetical protein